MGPQQRLTSLVSLFLFPIFSTMQIGCYILFSAKLDKHYIGACQAGFTQRLDAHNSAYYGSQSFTSSANDWELKIFIPTTTFGQALGIERKIKRMNSNWMPESTMVKGGHSFFPKGFVGVMGAVSAMHVGDNFLHFFLKSKFE